MSRTVTGNGFAAVIATVAVLSAGCSGGTSTPSTTASPTPATSATHGTSATPGVSGIPIGSGVLGAGARLIVLADGVDGGMGLWALNAGSGWVALGATPGATGLGRTADGVAVATGHDVDLRPASGLARAGTIRSLRWSGAAPTAPVVGLDADPVGKLAIVTADATSLQYALAAPDGAVTALTPAPTQTFRPLIAWLDDTRLLVLSIDDLQVSRLAVVDSSAATMDLGRTIGGFREFGLSADRQTVAAATEHGTYVGPVAAFMGITPPQSMIPIDDFQVVWAIALDADGSRIFMLSGTVEPNGTITSIRELGYAREGSGWSKVLDSPAPFDRAIAQVYLP
jgi:hypothetical protein